MDSVRALALGLTALLAAAAATRPDAPDLATFIQAAGADETAARAALDRIAASWSDGHAALLVDLARFMRPARAARGAALAEDDGEELPSDEDPLAGRLDGADAAGPETAGTPADPSARVRARLVRFLEKQTGQRFGDDLQRWRRWLWNRPHEPHPDYAAFKAGLYGRVDPRMSAFFAPGKKALIRLDEIDWGGVSVNGIPPLDHPKHVRAADARYLREKNVVFGVAWNGEARAYPKRILGWHEMARDRIGGVEMTIVYCPLCGTVIPYGSEVGGRRFTFGTSGLLYRSNKLMFDEETSSLWSTTEGRPVVGPLAGSPLELTAYPVVTTTWREWLAAHPETTVLSLETGHERDYSEGAAYRDYFATDRLMFAVPRTDGRLKNKAEVLGLRLRPEGAGPATEPVAVAIDAELLKRQPVHHLTAAGRELVVVTSPGGANRVYEAPGVRFVRQASGRLVDEGGGSWRITEDALRPDGREQAEARRVPARRAFWFGWVAQFPDTMLVR
jgi:hypothetical protein